MLLFLAFVLFPLQNCKRGDINNIKINQPKGSNVISNSHSQTSASYRSPHDPKEHSEIAHKSILDILIPKKNELIESRHGKYNYKLTLFDKLTQHEDWNSWTIGIFDKWDYCDSTKKDELCLMYNDGQACGGGNKRKINIQLTCNADHLNSNHLFDFSEPFTCDYRAKLYLSYICNGKKNDEIDFFANGKHKSISSININNMTSIENKLEKLLKFNELDNQWKLCIIQLLHNDSITKPFKNLCQLYIKTVLSSAEFNETIKTVIGNNEETETSEKTTTKIENKSKNDKSTKKGIEIEATEDQKEDIDEEEEMDEDESDVDQEAEEESKDEEKKDTSKKPKTNKKKPTSHEL